MSDPAYFMRAAGPDDFDAFKRLREIAGPGFTSLQLDDQALLARLEKSRASFAASVDRPGSERYLIALVHIDAGEIVGCCGVKATIGADPPFFNFRIIREAQASAAARRRFDMDVLIGVNDFVDCSEVGSLFVRPEHRATGVGRSLAQCRYLLMAADRNRFNLMVVSELRGVVSADGVSPFWDGVGRHFFQMDFMEADRLSATTDNQFILDLMPHHPIYVDLLPAEARATIGKCHKEGEGARRLLEWEGFTFSSVIDIFDGGPLLSAPRDGIRTLREAQRMRLLAHSSLANGKRALIATTAASMFRCAPTRATANEDGTLRVSPATLAALGLEEGAQALVWISDDAG